MTTLPEDATRNPLRRYALIAVVGLGLGAAAIVAARALTGGGGGGGGIATLDASAAPVATAIGDVDASAAPAIPSASTDAASVAPSPAADAAVVEPIARTGERRDGGSARVPPIAPVDAAPAVAVAPVDARPLPPIDAASANAVTPPAGQRTLKQLYADVTSAFNAAVARHGTARTAELRRRLDTLTPYTEAVRKPALRQQAEAELRALARDLAALDH